MNEESRKALKIFRSQEIPKENLARLEAETILGAAEELEFVQFEKDNLNATSDYKYAKEAAKIFEAEYYGPDNLWDLNKDPENGNVASEDYHECIESIKRMLWESKRKEHVKTHIGFFFISGKCTL